MFRFRIASSIIASKQNQPLQCLNNLSTRHGHNYASSSQLRCMVTVTKTSASSSPQVEITKSTSSTASPSFDLLNSDSATQSSLTSIQDRNDIIITPSAIHQITYLAAKRNPDDPSKIYLRVYVDAGGCSGFQYKFELENKDNDENPIDPEEDVIFNAKLSDGSEEIEVVVDEGSLEFIEGSKIDFVREMVKSSFAVVENPKSESACGCGSSFAMKNFESNPALD